MNTYCVLCSIFIFFSCSGEEGPINRDYPIIGIWNLIEIRGANGETKNILQCADKEQWIFNTNRTYTIASYTESNGQNCAIASQSSGQWKYEKEQYAIKQMSTSTLSQQGTFNQILGFEILEVIFLEENRLMRITQNNKQYFFSKKVIN
ncbi:MAG: lipocalin family protein [Flavobacteriaceae bacterium]|nr:lipocalin family protein [Flavobacteriaceae bacterium]